MELIKGRTLDDLGSLMGRSAPERLAPHCVRSLPRPCGGSRSRPSPWRHQGPQRHARGGRANGADGLRCRSGSAGPVSVTGDFRGRPLYLAPEVFAGQPRTRASDIYSLGILLFYLCTGTYPVTGDTRSQIDAALAAGHPSPDGTCGPTCRHLHQRVEARSRGRPSQGSDRRSTGRPPDRIVSTRGRTRNRTRRRSSCRLPQRCW